MRWLAGQSLVEQTEALTQQAEELAREKEDLLAAVEDSATVMQEREQAFEELEQEKRPVSLACPRAQSRTGIATRASSSCICFALAEYRTRTTA